MRHTRQSLLLCIGCLLVLTGCKTTEELIPDYTRKLAPGEKAFAKLPPDQWPNINLALVNKVNIDQPLGRSLAWFDYPSTKAHFPIENISHAHAQASVLAFQHILANSPNPAEDIRREFDCYQSVGFDREGGVLFTGYYTPIFDASRVKTRLYRYPLYQRPADLLSDPATGQILGRNVDGQTLPYPTRAEIEKSKLLEGQEIAWLRDPFDVYIIHIQGSARLELTDGTTQYLGYAGHNGHEYTSVAKQLVDAGLIDPANLSLQILRQYFKDHPDTFNEFLHKNERFVFFKDYPADSWPSGSLGFKVTPMRTLATDKSIFPRGGVVLVTTRIPTHDGSTRSFTQFMLDQDTGGAIKAPGRADIYMGSGDKAEALAGRQLATGNLYYFFLKYDRIHYWRTMR